MNPIALAAAVPVIIGLVGVLVKTDDPTSFGLSRKFAPILCVLLGIAVVFLFIQAFNLTTILVGIITGLSAVGAHAGTKSAVAAIKGNK